MKEIILTTINARYTHSSLGLRYLYANLNRLKARSVIKEYDISQDMMFIAEDLLVLKPRIICFGVYIWNVLETEKVISTIKKVAPDIKIILGGPEVSYEPFRMDVSFADHIVQGEAEDVFYELMTDIISLKGCSEKKKIIGAKTPDLEKVLLPYKYYNDEDIRNRVIYIEASRGCPFNCEFCLSSIDKNVRYFDLKNVFEAVDKLWVKGARAFKFIDRTFNLDVKITNRILDYFLQKKPPYFVHFEVVPEYFPDALKVKLEKFPKGCLQLEVGVQTLDLKVAANIKRKINPEKIKKNIRYLTDETAAYLHLDLIIGLPGQTVESFAFDLNTLVNITDSKIQLGILKKLSGTEISRHDRKFGMVYSDRPPYEILQNKIIPFEEMQKLKRMARYWEIVYNRHNFDQSVKLLWPDKDVFKAFYGFSDYIYSEVQATHRISLNQMAELIFDYILEANKKFKNKKPELAKIIADDLQRKKARKIPGFLREYI